MYIDLTIANIHIMYIGNIIGDNIDITILNCHMSFSILIPGLVNTHIAKTIMKEMMYM